MATDLEATSETGEVVAPRPGLKIVGLHIRGLKSIGSLDLPEDGLGWDGRMPDMMMIGGINGSGKTTLLEFLADAFEQCEKYPSNQRQQTELPFELPSSLHADEARIDFQFSPSGHYTRHIRLLVGDQDFIEKNQSENWLGFQRDTLTMTGWVGLRGSLSPDLATIARISNLGVPDGNGHIYPGVLYLPSERRTLLGPPTSYKFAGKLSWRAKFVDRWKPPEKWDDSLIARLYGIRWEDLNAKEEGRDREANGFDAYSRAFNRFFEGRKQLKWHRGELVVETKGGDIHDLTELSSGEKQVILFMGELLHCWRPGSLILIDEPELHLHESYQTRLWQSLVDWQKERGGQVIVATQSAHLFGLSGLGTRVILSGRRSR